MCPDCGGVGVHRMVALEPLPAPFFHDKPTLYVICPRTRGGRPDLMKVEHNSDLLKIERPNDVR